MSTAFTLSDATGKSYDFDLSGNVSQGGAIVGNWATDTNNNLAIRLSALGASVVAPIPVDWNFDQNELCVSSAGNLLYNFNSVPGVAPRYSVVNATIAVVPVKGAPFQFTLHPTWSLTDNHDLEVTIGAKTSTITGILEDDKSRFVFTFITDNPAHDESLYNLIFAGSWSCSVSASGDAIMSFIYKALDVAGNPTDCTTPFTLKQGVVLDKSINQFVYNYDKDGNTHSIQFVGELTIDSNFQITYDIDANLTTGASTIVIGTTFADSAFHGDLQLTVTKPNGETGATLTVGGGFQWVIGADTLAIGFAYSQDGATGGKTVEFNGSFTLKNGNNLQWDFQDSTVTNTISISVAAGFSLGPVDGSVSVNVKDQNGQLQGISVDAGFSF